MNEGKYARVERERRFLLTGPPPAGVVVRRRITDRYLRGTRLRLRREEFLDGAQSPADAAHDAGTLRLKLTQKIPAHGQRTDRAHVQGLITTTYLSPAEYDLLAALPAEVLAKTRVSVPPLGIDVFEPPLHGLVLAEAEFDDDVAARAFRPPEYCVAEVTHDPRFTGGRLVVTHRRELLGWLAEFDIAAPAET